MTDPTQQQINDSGQVNSASGEAWEAITAYNDLARSLPDLVLQSWPLLHDRCISDKVTFGGTPTCRYVRPQFLSPVQYTRIQWICSLLATAMEKLKDAMLADPALLALMDLSTQERRMVAVNPLFYHVSPNTRLDSFLARGTLQFVEYNAESPAAVAYEDVLATIFLDLPLVREYQKTYHLRPLFARDRLLTALLTAYQEYRAAGGTGGDSNRPVIAIVDWLDVPTASEFELFKEFFERRGLQALITDPRALTYTHGRLYAGSTPVDIVYKRVLTNELFEKLPETEPLLKAYEDHTVCVVNSFRAKLLHKKMIFGLLSDEAYFKFFTSGEQEAIQQHIPWTRRVAEGQSTYRGQLVDLSKFIQENRERLIMKPNDEYGGKGVHLGWVMGQQEWEEALTSALQDSYVVQERVELGKEDYPFVDESGQVQFRRVTPDLDPFIFGRDVCGILTRLSAAALLNVSAGTGSIVPTFVVEKR